MSIIIRKGGAPEVEQFIQLLYEVKGSMEYQQWLYLDPPEDFREMANKGILHLWAAMDGDRMAAAFDYLVPGFEEYNYGYDLDFSGDQLLKVVNMDTVAVHPDYRGKGLQRTLMVKAEQEIAGNGERTLLCTVHPDNHFSLQNILNQGYTIEKLLDKYGSVRYLLRKDIF